MNKTEILEIRRQLTPDRCTISRLCGCYVDHEKNKILEVREAFGALPDGEMFKYLDIFRHVLGGTVGKHLIALPFPTEQEAAGGTQEFLLRLRDSRLEDSLLLDEFYDHVIANYISGENYYIILAHAVYDVPGVTSDGLTLEDASDNVYEYLICAICPVRLSKAALGYNEAKNAIEDRFRDWVVEAPVNGFLFPAFIERGADIHEMLYFAKKPDDIQPEFIEALSGARAPMPAPTQQETFRSIVSGTVGEKADYTLMQSIHENLNDMIASHETDDKALALGREEVRSLLRESGVDEERMEYHFDKAYDESFGNEDYPLLAGNIANEKKFDIETPDVVIRVNPERADLVETRLIDGRQCLVIKVDDKIEVNGVRVRTWLPKERQES